MFAKQSQSVMPSSLSLHIDGISLPAESHPYQPAMRSYDYRTKHLQSPAQTPSPPLISPAANLSYSVTMIDGPYSHNNNNNNNMNKQYRILENLDIPKKMFKDRQIKKAKSLPGLIKGTALSRTSLHPFSALTSPAPSALSVNTLPDDQLPLVAFEIADDSHPFHHIIEQQNEIRRPRVYFADYNKVQFIEENKETSQQCHVPINDEPRQSRPRLTKKSSNANNINHTSPSIQRSPVRQNFTCPSSRQPCHPIPQESIVKKPQPAVSPRTNTSRITAVSDPLNQSSHIVPLSNENLNVKYALHREKPFGRLAKLPNDASVNLSLDFSSRTSHNNNNNDHTSPVQDSCSESHKSDSNDSDNKRLFAVKSPLSSLSINRQRSLLRTISLRQQFVPPMKAKLTDSTSITNTNNYQPLSRSLPNTQRTSTLKIVNSRPLESTDEVHANGSLHATEKRSLIGMEPGKQLKRSYVIHYHPEKSVGPSTRNYPNEINRQPNKSYANESTQEDIQNLLTIVRPPFTSGIVPSLTKPSSIVNGSTATTVNNHMTDNTHSSHHTNSHAPLEFHLTSRTIIV